MAQLQQLQEFVNNLQNDLQTSVHAQVTAHPHASNYTVITTGNKTDSKSSTKSSSSTHQIEILKRELESIKDQTRFFMEEQAKLTQMLLSRTHIPQHLQLHEPASLSNLTLHPPAHSALTPYTHPFNAQLPLQTSNQWQDPSIDQECQEEKTPEEKEQEKLIKQRANFENIQKKKDKEEEDDDDPATVCYFTVHQFVPLNQILLQANNSRTLACLDHTVSLPLKGAERLCLNLKLLNKVSQKIAGKPCLSLDGSGLTKKPLHLKNNQSDLQVNEDLIKSSFDFIPVSSNQSVSFDDLAKEWSKIDFETPFNPNHSNNISNFSRGMGNFDNDPL